MDDIILLASIISLVTAVIQLATAILTYKAYKREQDKRE